LNPLPQPPGAGRVLRRLFLTLFLRGRSSRGLRRASAPKSVASKLILTLLTYGLIGLVMAANFRNKPVFILSLYLHSMTLVFLGMFVAASAGEVLFNKDEADILLHRPITPQTLLWAKIAVLVQVSLWLSGAFNLAGLIFGISSANPGLLFPFVHAFSTVCEALFCTGCIVMVYQLCLRWFGRERLDGLMTTAQVATAVGAVLIGQMGPQLLNRYNLNVNPAAHAWIALLPFEWFAGIDDALCGEKTAGSWALAATALGATAGVLWLAFVKLARDYETGLQKLNEVTAKPRARGAGHRWIDRLVKTPPFSWWLRNSVARASFVLTTAYLVRDRDVKLRIYPGIAPMMAVPLLFLIRGGSTPMAANSPGMFDGFAPAFAGIYLGVIPMLGLSLIRYSQQWQAGDLFRLAPITGPGPLCDGARRAILCFLTLPTLVIFAFLIFAIDKGTAHLPLLLPGLILMPLYSLIPCIGGKAVPLSTPTEEAKSAGRGLTMFGAMIIAVPLACGAAFARSKGWLGEYLAVELAATVALYTSLRVSLARARWAPMD